ncbi:hypothetical protein H6P81_012048 [Aristolochia fimbriata]|uniref:DNA-directed RNA polymerase III subunit RPC6 n=1 Tax=Aristolochia fimbriata TaxID=158543 RepID=A0AAV7EAP2_ARIFI|nr:hypothetical protein H6P81_012048 [Aristolochia fimbriata]
MSDWGPVFIAVILFILFSPGLLFQLPGRNRVSSLLMGLQCLTKFWHSKDDGMHQNRDDTRLHVHEFNRLVLPCLSFGGFGKSKSCSRATKHPEIAIMGRTPILPAKRGRQDSKPAQALSETDKKVHDLIRSKGNQGIWIADVKRELNIQDTLLKKSIASLETRKLIKPVTSVQGRSRKVYMAVEFEPSAEVTGGHWYSDGNLDTDFITVMKSQCFNHIKKLKVATIEMVSDSIRKSGVFKVECSSTQISEMIQVLLLDGSVEQVTSSGMGDFSSIAMGKKCYRVLEKKELSGALSSFPCGACPRLIISVTVMQSLIGEIHIRKLMKSVDMGHTHDNSGTAPIGSELHELESIDNSGLDTDVDRAKDPPRSPSRNDNRVSGTDSHRSISMNNWDRSHPGPGN